MKNSIRFLSLIFFVMFSCSTEDTELKLQEIQFSFNSQKIISNGRISNTNEPKTVIVTIKDGNGAIVENRKEVALVKFGSEYLSLPLTLKTTGNSTYFVSEFLVTDQTNSVKWAAPKEGSELAHLVRDPLDISFIVSKDVITTVEPEVIEVLPGTGPTQFGYGQFGVVVVDRINVVYSAFIKNGNTLESTDAKIKIEGLSEATSTQPLWNYETNLIAGANNIAIKKASFYKVTATRDGYKQWSYTGIITDGSRFEIVLENYWTTLWNKVIYPEAGGTPLQQKTIQTAEGNYIIASHLRFSQNDHRISITTVDAQGQVFHQQVIPLPGTLIKLYSIDPIPSTANANYQLLAKIKVNGEDQGLIVSLNSTGEIKNTEFSTNTIYLSASQSLSNSQHMFVTGIETVNESGAQIRKTFFAEMDENKNFKWKYYSNEISEAALTELSITTTSNSYLLANRENLICVSSGGAIRWHLKNVSVIGKVFKMDNYLMYVRARYANDFVSHSIEKITTDGQTLTSTEINIAYPTGFLSLQDALTTTGGILLIGNITESDIDAWMAEVDFWGNILHQELINHKQFGVPAAPLQSFIFKQVIKNEKNEIAIAGFAQLEGGAYKPMANWLMKIK
jgi:hypothetical protein